MLWLASKEELLGRSTSDPTGFLLELAGKRLFSPFFFHVIIDRNNIHCMRLLTADVYTCTVSTCTVHNCIISKEIL